MIVPATLPIGSTAFFVGSTGGSSGGGGFGLDDGPSHASGSGAVLSGADGTAGASVSGSGVPGSPAARPPPRLSVASLHVERQSVLPERLVEAVRGGC